MLFIFCIILLTLARFCHNVENSAILECFKKVTKEYFCDKMVLLLYHREDAPIMPKQLAVVNDNNWIELLLRFLISSYQQTVVLSDDKFTEPNFEYFRLQMPYQRPKNIIMLLRSGDLEILIKLTDISLWNSKARVLIVMGSDDRVGDVLRIIWKAKRALYVTIMNVSDKSIRFYGSSPYQGINSTLIESFEDLKFKTGRILYPDDKIPKNFNGYVINAGVTYAEPYVLKPKKPGLYQDGVEVRIIETIGQHLNFQLHYMESPPGEHPAIPIVNNKYSGLFGLLHRREVDTIFLGIQARFDRFFISDPLYMHTQDNLVWITPVPDPIEVWKDIYMVFTLEIWIGILVTLVVTSITLYVTLPEPRNFAFCVLNIYAMNLNYGVGFPFTRFRVKLLFLFTFIYSLHMNLAYQSYLFMFWTQPPVTKPFETTRDAVNADLVAYLYPSGKPAYNQSDHDMWNKILRKGYHVYSDRYWETLPLVSDNKTALTLMAENVAKYEVSKRLLYDKKRLRIHFIKKKRGTYRVAMFLCLNHPLTDLINRKILQLLEGGLIDFWMGDLLTVYKKSKTMDENFDEAKPLTVGHFLGVFMILGLFWSIALVVFVIEVGFNVRN